MSYSEKMYISKKLIDDFACFSGDYSPIHVDEEFAKNTQFKRCIAHGAILETNISKILGMKYPGPGTIYVSQQCKFIKPVYIGDEVEFRITKKMVDNKGRLVLETNCFVDDQIVMKGEAVVIPQEI